MIANNLRDALRASIIFELEEQYSKKEAEIQLGISLDERIIILKTLRDNNPTVKSILQKAIDDLSLLILSEELKNTKRDLSSEDLSIINQLAESNRDLLELIDTAKKLLKIN